MGGAGAGSAGCAATHDVFLHLIRWVTRPWSGWRRRVSTDDDGQVTLTFDASGRTVTLRLRTSGGVGGHIRMTEGERVVVDQRLTEEVMPQEGLGANPR